MTEDNDKKADLMQLLDEHVKTIPRHPDGDNKEDCCCCAAVNVVAIAAAIALAGAGAGGVAIGNASGCCCCDNKERAYDSCIYVRGDTIIWAWNHGEQKWYSHDFNEPIIEVKSGNHSLLVISKTGAIVFDCLLGKFLTPLDASQEIKEGEIA
ncbi:MAG: hypothetical protein R8K53_02655 [Mariprofundaceae bacterium]